ncbi:molybdopterin-dependent oxidoreductase [Geobacter sp. SVR]|uniref:molybdopterin-dependent oxidoreductase n=1 Tax=Geobacter sp. SVR TaxID=2495594 RepID=UPI00143F00E9|nr:molybdopterin-dependent oxidoreductase [Geobacter sp. SVR]BCS52973.1 NADH-quinone oxidoreductase [Geobacter sp. SVR]GCF84357.1 NADH-quinone oxidoreductase [Geobacter sp. SVR]
MPKLIIDNIPVEVSEGTNVLDAAHSVGIPIPHFCWHPALGKAGACRVCAVKILDGPAKGLQMSCMLPAQDGMVVSTTDDEALAMRKSVIEWLMINHPHDCPVCDEGGECLLQDFTIAGGHGRRRYDGRKRTYLNQFLGPYIEHEMNRCIQCYRCVRFYQEYAGSTDFGAMGRASMIYFGRQQDGQLESPFSGNLVDICPTGVFTDKTARFRARYWDYDMAASICPHCSLGCNTIPAARYRELLKVVARRNDAVNGWFICDRGRFSNAAVNAPDRPRQPLVDGTPVEWDAALGTLAERLREFLTVHGPQALAIVGSPRMSHEGNIMAARLKELTGAGMLSYFPNAEEARHAMEAAERVTPGGPASLADVRAADLIVLPEGDLLAEAPMMALAVRQAWRNGARIYKIVPEAASAGNRTDSREAGDMYRIVTVTSPADVPLTEAKRGVVIHRPGTDMPKTDESAARHAFILNGPNAFGCAVLAREYGAMALSEALASGAVKGILSFEADLAELPPGVRVLASVDWQAGSVMQRAEVTLPATAWVEMEGTFVNNEGRAQRFDQVMRPGLPIKGLDPDRHPPREFGKEAPGGDLRPSWQIISDLLYRLGGEYRHPLSGCWASLNTLDSSGEGIPIR